MGIEPQRIMAMGKEHFPDRLRIQISSICTLPIHVRNIMISNGRVQQGMMGMLHAKHGTCATKHIMNVARHSTCHIRHSMNGTRHSMNVTRYSRPTCATRHTESHKKWGSPSASDPRAKIRANVPRRGTVLTSQSLSSWYDCRRLGNTLASWRWQDMNIGNPL